MIWTVFWKDKFAIRNRPDSVASFLSLEAALEFCRKLKAERRRVIDVVGPRGETLGRADISELLAA
jgi:hypothetical protein